MVHNGNGSICSYVAPMKIISVFGTEYWRVANNHYYYVFGGTLAGWPTEMVRVILPKSGLVLIYSWHLVLFWTAKVSPPLSLSPPQLPSSLNFIFYISYFLLLSFWKKRTLCVNPLFFSFLFLLNKFKDCCPLRRRQNSRAAAAPLKLPLPGGVSAIYAKQKNIIRNRQTATQPRLTIWNILSS